jgi:hypothetical protein
MYLVEDHRNGVICLVFTWEDPRKAGYQGQVIEGVTLEKNEDVHRWPSETKRPIQCVGKAPDNPKHYRVFKNESDLQSAGYQPVSGTEFIADSWKDYLALLHPEDLAEEDWFQQLDRYDEAARRRRARASVPEPPANSNRDEVAAWVAKKHLLVDSSIREVWYLPSGAPPEEIRLLELNDLLAGPESRAEAIDFGLDIEGAQFRLSVADITTEQLDRIQQDPSRLPPGWSLDEKRVWRRGA